jgi:hypothetical protein
MSAPRVTHFEIHAADPAKAAAFYSAVFGWRCVHHAQIDYWTVDTDEGNAPGINGGIVRRRGPAPADGQPVNAFVCTVAVGDLDAYFAKALAHGGGQAVPRFTIPHVGFAAYVKDPDGNILGLMQSDPAAR